MSNKTFELFTSKTTKLNLEILRYIQTNNLDDIIRNYNYDIEKNVPEFIEYMKFFEISIIPTLIVRDKKTGELLLSITKYEILTFFKGYFSVHYREDDRKESIREEKEQIKHDYLQNTDAKFNNPEDFQKVGEILINSGYHDNVDMSLYNSVSDPEEHHENQMRAALENSVVTKKRCAGTYYSRPSGGIIEMIKSLPQDPNKPGHPVPLDPAFKDEIL